ncbi:MAG: hypothetical protein HFH25_11040 [Lachnospiraceae bacterium]|nr:hypothetical protein [Lachnospiraceae bacterium]
MNKSKVSLVVSRVIEKIEIIAGFCWGGIFALSALLCMFDDKADGVGTLAFMWVLAALGFWVFCMGKKREKMRLEFKKYVTQLSVDPSGSLENLASATGTSVDVVKKNLQYMIKKEFFVDAFINEQENRLVLPSMEQRTQQNQAMQKEASGAAEQELVACICPCCGGMNKIAKGTTGECDFCSSPLQG